MNNSEALLILNAISGLGPKRARALITHFGSAAEVVSASQSALLGVCGIPEHAVLNLVHFSSDKFLTHEYHLLKAHGVSVITTDDADYPADLLEISDAPLVLYVQGDRKALSDPSVAIVGSRLASLYGMNIARTFAMELAQAGLTIVSGLARGIDTAAHEGTLKAHGVTVAVLGCGLTHAYPAENKELSERITERGAVISEFPMETPPVSFNFPRRNRIISGLSSGVVVVEAALKSGALITGDYALEQGREVYAVPGQIGNPASEGTNRLIQQGAKLAMSAGDVLEDLAPVLKGDRTKDNQPASEIPNVVLSREEDMLCSSLEEHPLHIDELADKTGLSVTQAALSLFQLELKKIVRQLPGQKYEKIKKIQEHMSTRSQEHKRTQV